MTCHWLHYIPNNLPLKSPEILVLPLSHSICPSSITEPLLKALSGDHYMNYKSKAYYISMSLLLLAMKTAKKGISEIMVPGVQKPKNSTLPSIPLLQKSKEAFWSRRVWPSIHFLTGNENPNFSTGWLALTESLNLRTYFLMTISKIISSSEISSQMTRIMLP